MKKMFAKTTLALAVAGVMAAPAFAVDGVTHSGANDRSKALQLNYYTHGDRANIWVNPALVGEYRNSAEVTVRQNGDGYNVGGVLYGIGDNQTIGVYLGRPNATNNFNRSFQFGSYTGLDNQGNPNPIGTLIDGTNPLQAGGARDNETQAPNNQFDLFYAMDMGEMAFGARLNVQMYERERTLGVEAPSLTQPIFSPLTFAGFQNTVTTGSTSQSASALIAETRQRDEAERAGLATPPAKAANHGIITGSITEKRVNNGSWSTEAMETNLSLGFNLKSIGVDGALLIGQASGEQVRSRSESSNTTEYYTVVGSPNVQANRVTGTFAESWKDSAEIDDGSTMALSLRGLVMQGENSTLHASLLYSTQDMGGKMSSVRNREQVALSYTNTAAATHTQVDQTTTTRQDERYSGIYKDEREVIQLGAAFRNMMTDATAVTVALGLRMDTNETGAQLQRDAHMQTVSNQYRTAALGVADVGGTNTTSTVRNTYSSNTGMLYKYDDKLETLSLPLTLAMEHSFNERWTVRASAQKSLYTSEEWSRTVVDYDGVAHANRRQSDVANTTTSSAAHKDLSTVSGPDTRVQSETESMKRETTWSNPATVAFGVGYSNGGVTVDTHLAKTTGADSDPFGSVTVTYAW